MAEKKVVRFPTEFSHKGSFGTTGAGKSLLLEQNGEIEYINNRKKIIDLINDQYIEGVSWVNPTRIKKFINFFQYSGIKLKNGFRAKPMGFPTEIYHPLCEKLPNKIPPNLIPYTLPLDFFAYEEVLRVLSNDSLQDSALVSITQEIERLKDEDSFSVVPAKISDAVGRKILKTKGFQNTPLYFHFDASQSASSASRPLLKAKNLGIFSSRHFPLILDDQKIRSMLLDRDTISVFSTKFIDQRYNKMKLAINTYLLLKIRDLAKGVGKTIVYLREARKLFPNSRTNDKSLKVLSEFAGSMAKDCRKSGIELYLDTQQPNDMPDEVMSQVSTMFIFRHDNKIADVREFYNKKPGLHDHHINNITRLKKRRFYVSSSNFDADDNEAEGNIVQFKFSDHLEAEEDEFRLLARKYPRNTWKSSNPMKRALAEEWRGSSKKIRKRFDIMIESEEESQSAKRLNMTPAEFKIVVYLYNRQKRGHTLVSHKEITLSTYIAGSTLTDNLKRLEIRGFVREDEETKKKEMTKAAIEFVEDNYGYFKKYIRK